MNKINGPKRAIRAVGGDWSLNETQNWERNSCNQVVSGINLAALLLPRRELSGPIQTGEGVSSPPYPA